MLMTVMQTGDRGQYSFVNDEMLSCNSFSAF